jgi:hypothetical protein
MRSFRIISSFLLALLLALPPVLKSAHEWSHSEDFHCHDTSTLHLHGVQHQCKLCDAFTGAAFLIPAVARELESAAEIRFLPARYSGFAHVGSSHPYFLRGPPVQ